LFFTARTWLALRGRLPRQLMTFLADAHAHRGVLRQVGAVYQFRHIELQRPVTMTAGSPASRLAKRLSAIRGTYLDVATLPQYIICEPNSTHFASSLVQVLLGQQYKVCGSESTFRARRRPD